MKLRKGDTVIVLTGRDKWHKGKIRKSLPEKGCVIVEGANKVKRHTKPRGQAKQAGIIEQESAMPVSNVMLICSKCNHPTRPKSGELKDGTRARICRNCGEVMD
jgi:large subunit ribosomal protein L24